MKWIPVDNPPDKSVSVLVTDGRDFEKGHFSNSKKHGNYFRVFGITKANFNVTHYLIIPELPKK